MCISLGCIAYVGSKVFEIGSLLSAVPTNIGKSVWQQVLSKRVAKYTPRNLSAVYYNILLQRFPTCGPRVKSGPPSLLKLLTNCLHPTERECLAYNELPSDLAFLTDLTGYLNNLNLSWREAANCIIFVQQCCFFQNETKTIVTICY